MLVLCGNTHTVRPAGQLIYSINVLCLSCCCVYVHVHLLCVFCVSVQEVFLSSHPVCLSTATVK